MGFLQGAAWVLLGVTLGTATCSVLVGLPLPESAATAARMANLFVFAMLVGSLHCDPKNCAPKNWTPNNWAPKPSPVRR